MIKIITIIDNSNQNIDICNNNSNNNNNNNTDDNNNNLILEIKIE